MIVKGLIERDAAGGLAPTDRGRAVRRALLPDHETERRATPCPRHACRRPRRPGCGQLNSPIACCNFEQRSRHLRGAAQGGHHARPRSEL